MKKLKLIYNPNAGSGGFKYDLDPCVQVFQNAGYETHLFKSMRHGDIAKHLSELDISYDALVVSGGDGTINIAVNSMMTQRLDIPLGIIPSGTANDFATFLKLPPESDCAAEVIAAGNTIRADVGMANDKYFINVCSAGLFTNVSQSVDGAFKSMLGKLAYYIKGLEQLPNFVPIDALITNSDESFRESLFLFVVLNSAGTGGFSNLSPDARIDDGLLDFIGIREMPLIDLASLFLKLLRGVLLDDPNVIFFRDDKIRVESPPDCESKSFAETDIDGERGPDMPVEIKLVKKGIEIFAPANKLY